METTNAGAKRLNYQRDEHRVHLSEFGPILKKLPSLWTRSYFVSTALAVSAETIQSYIEAQQGG